MIGMEKAERKVPSAFNAFNYEWLRRCFSFTFLSVYSLSQFVLQPPLFYSHLSSLFVSTTRERKNKNTRDACVKHFIVANFDLSNFMKLSVTHLISRRVHVMCSSYLVARKHTKKKKCTNKKFVERRSGEFRKSWQSSLFSCTSFCRFVLFNIFLLGFLKEYFCCDVDVIAGAQCAFLWMASGRLSHWQDNRVEHRFTLDTQMNCDANGRYFTAFPP